MTKDIKNNTYTFCRLRDKQFALYVMYAKSNKIMMKTLLIVNSLYYFVRENAFNHYIIFL